ncbi:MAG: replication initiation protein [Candidatus Altimarinota bacterium]
MTTLQKYKSKNEELKELLIKNLPTKIKGGNEKHLSNIYEYQTVKALDKCKFINFNSDKQISFMVFDIDKYEDKTAKEYFKNINGFYEYISGKIGLEPTYILETPKGFHFAYHLKNHIFTNQKKPLNYLLAIKQAITELLKCDSIASNRLYGIWRNPLLHPCYYSQQINYELKDFKELLPKIEYKNHSIRLNVKINEEELIEGQRNTTLFKYAMRFAKNQKSITQNDILNYLIDINESKQVNLLNSELKQISNSVFKYWKNGKIRYGVIPTKKDINEGIMNFSKMKNLSKEEYELETKRRQKEAAIRTISIRDKEKNKKQLLEAKRDYEIKKQEENEKKVLDMVLEFQNQNKKINFSEIGRLCGLDRKTVKKYYLT